MSENIVFTKLDLELGRLVDFHNKYFIGTSKKLSKVAQKAIEVRIRSLANALADQYECNYFVEYKKESNPDNDYLIAYKFKGEEKRALINIDLNKIDA